MAAQPGNVFITEANRGLGTEMVKQIVEAHRPVRNLQGSRLTQSCGESLHLLCAFISSCVFANHKVAERDKVKKQKCCIDKNVDDLCSIKECIQQVGSLVGTEGLNLLINNTGALSQSALQETSPEDMLNTFNSNVIGPTNIIKAGLNMLTLCAAEELKKDEILFSLLHPGWERTDMRREGETDAPESVEGMLQ